MPTRIFLKPNPAQKIDGKPVRVFDPAHRDFLPESGRSVILNVYWVNRLRNNEVLRIESDGDVQEHEPSKTEIITGFKSKKDVIKFACENISEEFADSLDDKAKLDELKSAVINELNK